MDDREKELRKAFERGLKEGEKKAFLNLRQEVGVWYSPDESLRRAQVSGKFENKTTEFICKVYGIEYTGAGCSGARKMAKDLKKCGWRTKTRREGKRVIRVWTSADIKHNPNDFDIDF